MFFGRQSIIDILLEECLMYLRKSRSDDPTLTVQEVLRNHEAELDDWCERNISDKVPQKNRFKEVVSGEKMSERPELQKLLREIEKPNIKYIITNEPSRLSRGYLDEIGFLIKLLRYNKITVITPGKIYNLEDEYDREAFERELKRGNEYLEYSKKVMKRGKDRKVADGEYISVYRPFGYQKFQYKEGRRTIKTLKADPTEMEIVKLVFDWYGNQNVSQSEIAKRLNDMNILTPKGKKWCRDSNLNEMLSNPVYIGKIRWRYKVNTTTVSNQEIVSKLKRNAPEEVLIFEGLHDGIIEEELFYRVQEMKKAKAPVNSIHTLSNPLAGIVKCKKCGHNVRLKAGNKGKKRFVCDYSHCVSSGVDEEEFMDSFINALENSIDDFEIRIDDNNDREIDEHKSKISILEKRLKQLEQQELSQWQTQMNPNEELRMPPHIFKQLNDSVVKEMTEVRETLNVLYSTSPKKVDYSEKILTFKKALEYIKDDSISAEDKNIYLKSFIDRIDFERDKMKRLKKHEAEKLGIPFQQRVPCFDNPKWTMEIYFKE